MGSWFDTEVYQKRRRNPYVSPNPEYIKRDVQYYGDEYFFFGKDETANGSRWICEFNGPDGQRIKVWSVEKELCLWRAIVALENRVGKLLQYKHGKGLIYPDAPICTCGHPKYKNEEGETWCSNIYHPY